MKTNDFIASHKADEGCQTIENLTNLYTSRFPIFFLRFFEILFDFILKNRSKKPYQWRLIR